MHQLDDIIKNKAFIVKFDYILHILYKYGILKFPSRYEVIKHQHHRNYLHFINKNGRYLTGQEASNQFYKYLINNFTEDEKAFIWVRKDDLILNLFRIETMTYHRRILEHMIKEITSIYLCI